MSKKLQKLVARLPKDVKAITRSHNIQTDAETGKVIHERIVLNDGGADYELANEIMDEVKKEAQKDYERRQEEADRLRRR